MTLRATSEEIVTVQEHPEQSGGRKSLATIADDNLIAENEIHLARLTLDVPATRIDGYEDLVNFAPTADQPIHRWFRYREGYSQELVREFTKELPRGSTVLDPFCGSGTTLLVAREHGLAAAGFDVNPISVLVSKVKSTPVTSEDTTGLRLLVSRIKAARRDFEKDPKPGLSIIGKIFDPEILDGLLIFRKIINEEVSPHVRNFAFVAWLAILEGLSNVYKEGNGIKYRNRKRTSTGYVQLDLEQWANSTFPDDRFEHVRSTLLAKIESMLSDVPEMPVDAPPSQVYEAGAEHLEKYIPRNSVSLVIFSPPYCNCFNYFKMYKVELWMGGFVNSYEEMRALNRRGLRSHVETTLRRDGDTEIPEVENVAKLLDEVQLWDKRIPDAVRGYFNDMSDVLRSIHEVLKPSGRCVIVVGNSAYGGLIVATDAILAKIAKDIGFNVENLSVARHLTTSSQQRLRLGDRMEFLRESLLVLSKPDPRLVDRELHPVDEIPIEDNERTNKVFLIRNNRLTAGTHKFHRYPAKFIPHIPRWALHRYAEAGQTVLDPFCGSGTTLVETALFGAKGIGVDIDPIAKLVSRVKCTHIPKDELQTVEQQIISGIEKAKPPRFRPTIPTLAHWFNEDAVRDLGIIREQIERYRDRKQIYEFLLVCMLSIIRRASNADNQTQKTYVSGTKPKIPEKAIPLFLKSLSDYAQRIQSLSRIDYACIPTVLDNADARNLSAVWSRLSLPPADLVVTSPPYLNSVDYVYNQMAEYFWIGDLFGMETQAKQNVYKKNYVGTDKFTAKEYSTLLHTGIPSVDAVVEAVGRDSAKNGYITAKYFSDMYAHFRETRNVVKGDARYVAVVGDSLIGGHPILVNELLVDCAEAAGFVFHRRFGYEIRNRHMRFPRMGRGGIVRYDWVLEFSVN